MLKLIGQSLSRAGFAAICRRSFYIVWRISRRLRRWYRVTFLLTRFDQALPLGGQILDNSAGVWMTILGIATCLGAIKAMRFPSWASLPSSV